MPGGHAATADSVQAEGHANPAGQIQHRVDPGPLYCPAGQGIAVALLVAAGHVYPAGQGPEHSALVSPVEFPKRPAVQLPEQALVASPLVFPYRPWGQGVQLTAPPTLYCPTAQGNICMGPEPTEGHA